MLKRADVWLRIMTLLLPPEVLDLLMMVRDPIRIETVHSNNCLVLDISYQSLAAAFSQCLVHHEETLRRMREASKHRIDFSQQTEDQRVARERMALFPDKGEVLFVHGEAWVVSSLLLQYMYIHIEEGNVFISLW